MWVYNAQTPQKELLSTHCLSLKSLYRLQNKIFEVAQKSLRRILDDPFSLFFYQFLVISFVENA